MKVLFTGMGSNHCKRPENTTFFSTLADQVAKFADVTWASPKMSWTKQDLDKFDAVVFGFLAPTSLSANKIFGALHVLGLMYESPKLKLVIDGPQMWQYKNSVKALQRDVGILFTSFYSRREQYLDAKERPKSIELAVEKMNSGFWPKTIYPSLPWIDDAKVAKIVNFLDEQDLIGVNLDGALISPEPPRIGRKDLWAVENPKNQWAQDLDKLLTYPRIPTKIGRKTDDVYALGVIRNSIGLILPPQERKVGTWWNYRMYQALNTGTPIATYWDETYKFDPSWAALAYNIEDYDSTGRQMLANSQRFSYLNAIPKIEDSVEQLKNNLLDSVKERI